VSVLEDGHRFDFATRMDNCLLVAPGTFFLMMIVLMD
jgi:hypothetical protein